jgi:hypothetical protein
MRSTWAAAAGHPAGIWGAIVRRWLDELLPADAHERCSGRVSIVLTQLPLLSTVSVDRFPTKASLIDAALASAHVPFFMDGQLAASYAGGACIDGSFSYILFGWVCCLARGRAVSSAVG